MKKCLTGILIAALLFTALSGCVAVDPQPTETDDGPITLHVLTNAPDMHMLDAGSSKTYSLSDEILYRAQSYHKAHGDVIVELEILPTDAEERELRAQQLRTEIMGGSGPDIYIMSDWPPLDDVNGNVHFISSIPADDTVFQNVAMSMRNGLFYDISDYYDNDSDLGKDSLITSVMDAGKVSGARYVLPLRYTYPVIYADKAALDTSGMDVDAMKASVNGFYNELLKKGEQTLARSATRLFDYYPFFAFSDLMDYDSQIVTLRVEDAASYMRDLQALVLLAQGYASAETTLSEENPIVFAYLENASGLIRDAEDEGMVVEAFPLRSMDGQLIANIKTWGAVSSNCAHSDVAYDFLREFLLEDSQWETIRRGRDFIEGSPVRPEASENETVSALIWTPVDQARFTINEEYAFEQCTRQKLYDVSSNTTYTASDIDIDAAAQDLIDSLRWHMAEG